MRTTLPPINDLAHQEKWGQSNFFQLDELAWLIVTKKLL